MEEARKKRKEVILFKVDFENACDLVDWKFLESMMLKMGFNDRLMN